MEWAYPSTPVADTMPSAPDDALIRLPVLQTDRRTPRCCAKCPDFNPDADAPGERVPAPVAEMRSAVRAADALLICTPEYGTTYYHPSYLWPVSPSSRPSCTTWSPR
jgi:hypothetical protein